MKHILYPIPVLLLIVCSLVFSQCSSRGPYNPQLVHIDSLLNQEDLDTSAVSAAFRRVSTSLDGFDDDNRMYYNLLTQFYLFKTYQPVENDSVLRAVIQYYGDEASKEGLLANYVGAGMYYDRKEYEKAQDCGLRFLRMTEKTSDFDMVMKAKCHITLGDTYEFRLPNKYTLHQMEQATLCAEQTTDSLLMADCYYALSQVRKEGGDYQLALRDGRRAYDVYSALGYHDKAAWVWLQRVKCNIALGDYDEAQYCLRMFEKNAKEVGEGYVVEYELNNETYYYVKGSLCEKTGAIDSAFMYYYRELGSGDVGYKMGACDNLQKLYASLGQRDSSDKYNQLHQKFRKEMDSKYDISTLLEKQIEFDAHNHFMELLRYVLYGVGAIVMVVGLFWKRKKVAAGFVALFSSLKKRRAQKKGQALETSTANGVSASKAESFDVEQGKGEQVGEVEVESSAGSASGALLKRYGAQLGNANVVQVDYGQAASLVYFRRLLGKGRYPSADDPKWFLLLRYVDENDVRFSRFLKDMQKSFGRIDYTHVRVCVLIRAGFRPSEIARLMNVSVQAISNMRKKLSERLFEDTTASPERLDVFLRGI